MNSAVCQFVARRLLYVTTTRSCVASNYDIVDKEGIKQQQGEGKELQIITSSLRLDAVAARGLDLSRRYVTNAPPGLYYTVGKYGTKHCLVIY